LAAQQVLPEFVIECSDLVSLCRHCHSPRKAWSLPRPKTAS
jgi:hypothetical protein